MDVSFCDICDSPIHEEKFVLISIKETDLIELQEELKSVFFKPLGINKKFDIDRKEICSSCHKTLGLVFAEKKAGLSKVIDEIERMYKFSL